ncbi:MAG: protein kinase, partial [candidate division Zixibacteria bacterium]|nr:protein kinase [candidate division Zixibacteria bacterium]
MIGKTISHYKILEKLGEGGMGEVYLAEDMSLGRKVAIKFLSSDKASDPESRQRFVQEARTQAMLSHPNIATFHEVGEAENKAFIVMEYIEGRPLSDLAQVEKPSLPEILDLAIQVGEGLSAAHEKGVVHRDIKPENVLVTAKHHAKITDFGLAKWKGASTLTKTGARMGTAYYMSPEQVEGKKVDNRTDIFSLGVVLYELLCARRPFEGDTDAAIFYDLINTQPQPLARFARNIPEKLEQIVLKCLAKKPEERYQHADELVADLKALRRTSDVQHISISRPQSMASRKSWVGISAGLGIIVLALAAYLILPRFFTTASSDTKSGRKMLAVLPFDNLGSAEEEYFADGITEEITTRLAKIGRLGVISHTSSRKYKKTDKTMKQIGAELGADYILEGNIRWAKSGGNSRLRINPQLIRVSDDSHLWAENYDAVLNDVFELQSNIAEKVAVALGLALLEPERKSLQAKPTENLEAYDFYLRGNDYFNRTTAGMAGSEKYLRIAFQMYERAVDLDSNFALAHCQFSRVNTELYWHYDRKDRYLKNANAGVEKAFKLSSGLPESHLALGSIHYHAREYEKALAQFSMAQKSLPNNPDIWIETGYVQRRQGKWALAIASFKKAAELDPGRSDILTAVGGTNLRLGKYAEAESYFKREILLDPGGNAPYRQLVDLYLKQDAGVEKARKILVQAAGKVAATELTDRWVRLEVLEGNYPQALSRLNSLEAYDNDSALYYLVRAEIYGLIGRADLKRSCYDSARVLLEKKLRVQPENEVFH